MRRAASPAPVARPRAANPNPNPNAWRPPSPPQAQESQVALLRLAERHQQPLPYQNNDYSARLQLLAARKQAEAVQAAQQ